MSGSLEYLEMTPIPGSVCWRFDHSIAFSVTRAMQALMAEEGLDPTEVGGAAIYGLVSNATAMIACLDLQTRGEVDRAAIRARFERIMELSIARCEAIHVRKAGGVQ